MPASLAPGSYFFDETVTIQAFTSRTPLVELSIAGHWLSPCDSSTPSVKPTTTSEVPPSTIKRNKTHLLCLCCNPCAYFSATRPTPPLNLPWLRWASASVYLACSLIFVFALLCSVSLHFCPHIVSNDDEWDGRAVIFIFCCFP
ncbi:uncharacterized protein BJ171DRAFT_445405 [Polychytrium aggregatum]|uniref:uncharacterized protein n=1 Tax=Polychytrium aggregatum TaxID=110093 RepID=UPI0022FF33B5|nr:uncharacterized protein BJ171DRAFT_445405 [Polychytrium aggregatum]KAI9199601.1 hypothetical protein BJ171DRAFT_445405 [Polychytrium aggregatum]